MLLKPAEGAAAAVLVPSRSEADVFRWQTWNATGEPPVRSSLRELGRELLPVPLSLLLALGEEVAGWVAGWNVPHWPGAMPTEPPC